MWTNYLVWGLFVNALKILAGKRGLCSTVYDALWVYSFKNFYLEPCLGSTLAQAPGFQRPIKPVPTLKMLRVLGICQEIKQ